MTLMISIVFFLSSSPTFSLTLPIEQEIIESSSKLILKIIQASVTCQLKEKSLLFVPYNQEHSSYK